ncbi:MAG: diaminopimelate epimerase [Verrucomicrobiales bacterium]|jgi:diaminopimelate epimerase
MQIEFTKMNGAGNDFVVLDNRDLRYQLSTAQIERLCNRQRGIGADGLLAVEPAENGADFRMRYYNADGGEAEMCGNGARCFANFLTEISANAKESVTFETIAGVIEASYPAGNVRIQLSDPFDQKMGQDLEVLSQQLLVHSINTGVPHACAVVDDVAKADIVGIGRALRFHEAFQPSGTNANLFEVKAPDEITLRTYERGVENETLACGTGMVASAIVHHELTGATTPIKVNVQGGDQLIVEFDKTPDGYRNVYLTGPADFTFSGTIQLP